MPAITSITHRVTGAILSGGMAVMGLIALTSTCDIPMWVEAFHVAHPILWPVLKTGVAFPVVYHTLAGVRHLVSQPID
jgi:succinate dehydrogenase cytochrome b556 subunit